MVNHVKYNSSVTCITWLPIEVSLAFELMIKISIKNLFFGVILD